MYTSGVMRATIPASISVALLLLSGCGGAPPPPGVYRGERPLTTAPGTDPVVAAQMRRIVLTIGDGGKTTLEDGGIPWEGLLTRHGDRLDFEVLAVAGVNVAKQAADLPRRLELRVLDDGALEYANVRLRKTPSPSLP